MSMLIPFTFSQLCNNCFVFDSSGIIRYFISPIKGVDVITHKLLSLFFYITLLGMPFILFIIINKEIDTLLSILCVFVYLYSSLVVIGCGAIISLLFPYKVEYNKIFGQFNPFSSLLISFISDIIGFLPVIIIIFIPSSLLTKLSLILLLIIVITFLNYHILRNVAATILKEKREFITENIIGRTSPYE